ncbi:LysE family translocator [Parahaliea mediterranea]|uniref:LysE family translocator n=1 Tax=Parahaliea mediterranea TaxID=651086 RepID=A0A939DFZ6_9GAMM|nr:LysE family translocator [Parahaliea mediterranea]MBN7796812.1 LysE family translocator [Parahaliea mediterranea]
MLINLSLLFSLAVFAAAMTGTPGPNNIMLTASGANFGFARTVPHVLGVSTGVASLIATVAAGLGVLFEAFPLLQQGLRLLACAYLLYLAWRIGSAPPPARGALTAGEAAARPGAARSDAARPGAARPDAARPDAARPMRFHEALLFQYVNPKAWAMAITAVGSFTVAGEDYWLSAALTIAVFVLVGLPLTSGWAAFGVLLGRALSSPAAWRWFNRCMGVLTASCLVFIW